MSKLGKYFSLEELTVTHENLDNTPGVLATQKLKILVQNLLVTSCVIFIIIFARDKPPTPPSNSAEKKDLGYKPKGNNKRTH
jgi:hypothetical protein